MYQYILFDLDGTLTDPKIGITTCVQYGLHKMGIEEPDLDRLEPFIGPPLLDSFMTFYGMSEEQAEQAIAFYRERFSVKGLFENKVYPGIPEVLSSLKQAGRKLAIASSKPTVYVRQILAYFSIESYFDVIVGSELDGRRSRKEEVVEEALRQLLPEKLFEERKQYAERRTAGQQTGDGAEEACIAMVGDRKFDVEGAKEYGIVSVAVAYGYAQPGELEEAGAEVIAPSVEKLGEVLMA